MTCRERFLVISDRVAAVDAVEDALNRFAASYSACKIFWRVCTSHNANFALALVLPCCQSLPPYDHHQPRVRSMEPQGDCVCNSRDSDLQNQSKGSTWSSTICERHQQEVVQSWWCEAIIWFDIGGKGFSLRPIRSSTALSCVYLSSFVFQCRVDLSSLSKWRLASVVYVSLI